jgi:hypothetical protein
VPGIKKRNHKMLDYDSMRSKVKRLTEKPDKDPAKLPRTEKEQDMVSLSRFLHNLDDISPTGSFVTIRESNASLLSVDTVTDLGVPSPPKALNGIRHRLGLGMDEDEDLDTGDYIEDDLDTEAGDEDDLDTGDDTEYEDEALLETPTRGRRTTRTLLGRTASIISSYSTLISPRRDSDFEDDEDEVVDENEDEGVSTTHSSPLRSTHETRYLSNIQGDEDEGFWTTPSKTLRSDHETRSPSDLQADEEEGVSTAHSSPSHSIHQSLSDLPGDEDEGVSIQETRSLSDLHGDDLRHISNVFSTQSTSTLISRPTVGDSASTRGGTWPRQKSIPNTHSRPFFEPSELEEIMAPVKEQFMQKQADKLEQAKAAYEQLNEQLMSELPQLIDLRYVKSDIRKNFNLCGLTTNNFCLKQSPLPRPHIRSAGQNPTTLLRGSLQPHGASATVPRCFDARPVCQW